jgi:hypothetical protein
MRYTPHVFRLCWTLRIVRRATKVSAVKRVLTRKRVSALMQSERTASTGAKDRPHGLDTDATLAFTGEPPTVASSNSAATLLVVLLLHGHAVPTRHQIAPWLLASHRSSSATQRIEDRQLLLVLA